MRVNNRISRLALTDKIYQVHRCILLTPAGLFISQNPLMFKKTSLNNFVFYMKEGFDQIQHVGQMQAVSLSAL